MRGFIVRGYRDDEQVTDSLLRDTRPQAETTGREWLESGLADEYEVEDLSVTFG